LAAISRPSLNLKLSNHLSLIVHFHRKAPRGAFSIERLFETLSAEMSQQGVCVNPHYCPWYSRGIFRRLLNLLNAWRYRCDVNHITGDVHYLALGLPRDRTILTIHDLQMLDRLTGWRRRLLIHFWFTLPVKRCRFVTVISGATKSKLLEIVGCEAEKILVIPNAINPSFQPSPKEFNAECPTILQIGTRPNKNVARLIDACRGLNLRLHIIGELTYEDQERLESSGVQYQNDVNVTDEEIMDAYQRCDAVSFCSLHEGFGMPILEAQWIERPVITSNLSSMPFVAGDAACFVDPLDVDSIRVGLRRVLEDQAYREELIEKGRLNRNRFCVKAIARQYIDIYEKIAPVRPV
jgi:glycosyltransferase involved in cell wall biosynthesis